MRTLVVTHSRVGLTTKDGLQLVPGAREGQDDEPMSNGSRCFGAGRLSNQAERAAGIDPVLDAVQAGH